MKITPIPIFEDNYVWVIESPALGAEVAVVDPGDAEPVSKWLKANGKNLTGILITHHHWDHVDGIGALTSEFPHARVIAPLKDRHRIPDAKEWVSEGEEVHWGGLKAKVMEVPGHTLGHIVYSFEKSRVAFVGDTIFSCGCGRLFEGSHEQMFLSLQKIIALPGETRLFCTHEYTLKNIEFALTIEPTNPDLIRWKEEAMRLRSKSLPTLPRSLAEECKVNPFLRAHSVERFRELREKRDRF